MFLYTVSRGKEVLLKKIIRFFWLWCFVLVQNVCLTNIARGVEQNECDLDQGCHCAPGYCLTPKGDGGTGTPRSRWCRKCSREYVDNAWYLSNDASYCPGLFGYAWPDPNDYNNCQDVLPCPGDKVGNADYSGCECPAGKYNSSGNTCTVCQTGKYREAGFGEGDCTQCHMAGYYGTTRPGNAASLHDNKNDCVIEVIFDGNDGYIKTVGSGLINPTVYAEYVPVGSSEVKTSCYFQDINAVDQPVGDPVSLCKSTQYGFKVTDGVDGAPTKFIRAGHTFAGWFKDENLTQLVAANDVFPGKEPSNQDRALWVAQNGSEVHLYAKWCKTSEHKVAKNGTCVCEDGYIGNGDTCTACPEGYFCKNGNKNQCFYCFQHSDAGSDSPDDCYAKLTLKVGEEDVETRAYYNETVNNATCEITGTSQNPLGGNETHTGKACMVCEYGVNDRGYCLRSAFANAGQITYFDGLGGGIRSFYPNGFSVATGAVFDGWYLDEERSDDFKVGENRTLCGDNTLYPKFICKQRYYTDPSPAGGCRVCPTGKTTVGNGATSIDDCKQGYKYGSGKYWTWPDAVTPDEILIPNP